MAEADAEERPLELAHPLPDRALLGDQPGILLDIPHIHRPAHDPQRVIGTEVGNRLALVQLDRIPADAVLLQEFPEDARMLDRDVLENQEAHGFRGQKSGIRGQMMD